MPSDRHGLRRVLLATRYSWQGLRAAWRKEEAFRQEVIVALVALPVAWFMGDSAIERALLMAVILNVLILELVNTAVENVVDRVGTDPHKLSGRAKDIGSAAVFMGIVLAAVVWGLILFG
ncbi:MAG: diacylglycerol kinase [Pseudomonadota bacterium]